MINDNPILNIDYIENGDIKQFAGISLSNWKEYRKQNKDSKIEVKSWSVWQTPVEELRERYQQVAKQYFDSEKVENNESNQVEETEEKQETEIPGIVWTNIEKNDQDNSKLDETNPKIDWILKSQEQQKVDEATQEIPDRKKAVYNTDFTECLEIGWFTNSDGQIQIEEFADQVAKVPKELPKQITSLQWAFYRNDNTEIDGIQYWDTSNVISMNSVFRRAYYFNQDISSWDTSKVTDMNYMFEQAESFNQPLNNWDTSNVTSMSNMFCFAYDFNQPLSKWNVSKVEEMYSMFFNTKSFNQDISSWNTSNVTNMGNMFAYANKFNQDLSNWDVYKVEDFENFNNKNSAINEEFLPKFGIIKQQENLEKDAAEQENINLNEADEEIFNTLEEIVELKLQQNELKQIQNELSEKLDEQIKNAQESLEEVKRPVQKQELTFENKISDIVKRVDDKLDEFVRDPEQLANYLEFATNIRNKYTARNIAMVHKQFSGATILKSFTDWKTEKIAIKKGSKALKILQPVTDKFVEINGEKIFKKQWTDEVKQKIKKKELKVDEAIKGFKLANTFDISQTTLTKERYPKNYFATFIKAEPENEQYHQQLFSDLKQFLETKNIPVYETEALGQVKGFTDHKSIYLNEHNSTKQNVKTLFHEYGHMKFKHSYEDTSRSECEYQAEMISLVFCKKFNIETENYNLDYIKSWIKKTTQKDRIDWIKPVVNVAREINDEIELFLKQQLEAKEKQEQEKKQQEQLQQEQEKKRQELQ
ncbi:BspA family leucine-rich repeat surface protein [Mycoplasma yeatsii]|uniref:BspA family leucine-rich repeat surface protein n=1 Tax=Mycoplasma yeatsii TaxID=51365 RepID=UPI0005B23A61|nr:BspA family leucine-rich repeat surface protein [Mycoplasma yeatsii]AJM71555.1 PARCEL domain-containing protein [Mycoplasma yeatsii GM274B]